MILDHKKIVGGKNWWVKQFMEIQAVSVRPGNVERERKEVFIVDNIRKAETPSIRSRG